MKNIQFERTHLRKLIYSAAFLGIALLLPFLTGQLQQVGNKLLPMHLPVLLCGFLCGGVWGLAVGFAAPLLRGLLFGMPPPFPTGVAMAFELAAYGFSTGMLSRLLPKKIGFIYVNLFISMLAGRLVWGAVSYIIAGFSGTEFSFSIFYSAAVLNALPGIIIQIVLIPLILIALKRARIDPDKL